MELMLLSIYIKINYEFEKKSLQSYQFVWYPKAELVFYFFIIGSQAPL